MSGSSLDGLDLALCIFKNEFEFELVKQLSVPYSEKWENRLAKSTDLNHKELCLLEAEYTKYVASLITDFLQGDVPDYVSSHGHTLLHSPVGHYSYQLCLGSYLSAHLGLPVISDFRLQDMAKGGQGAPIAPVVEKYLFSGYDSYLNLGGICNCSFHKVDSIVAYDIGPCNQLLNALAQLKGQAYDHNGELASQGQSLSALFEPAINHPYYHQDYPKSLDNQFVQKEFVKEFLNFEASAEDKLRTAVDVIVHIITSEYSNEISNVFATGGGALNLFLMAELQKSLASLDIKLIIPAKEIIEFKEAILMALMGYLRIHNKVNVFSSVTGATSDTVAGCIYV